MLNGENAIEVMKVLASRPRMQILEILSSKVLNISEIASMLGMTQPSVSMNVQRLEEVGLIKTEYQPGQQGFQKVCRRVYNDIVVHLPKMQQLQDVSVVELAMPIGLYHDLKVKPPCGIITDTDIIGTFDEPSAFLDPKRVYAQLLWFTRGYMEYVFPNNVPAGHAVDCLELSLEICSEAPMHDPDYPSEISLWINTVKIGTWVCPGDYGGEPGKLTPDWWRLENSQYGLLKRWTVNTESKIDGVKISDVGIDRLDLASRQPIRVRIGVEEDSKLPGGMNLFGEKFGNYPCNINLRLLYTPKKPRTNKD